ncbi:hypothetical protein EK21DRAFT_63958 [Setomelanomma holmii]|uniref:Uncharacterized protein n=1 Tax=Setomelanomma holmii TaxID=210430 RepID=A0A9P4LNB2_9PLEO|nr:hypothetical protein EK21DRAFT_63958 [Setomelanomma holmii]
MASTETLSRTPPLPHRSPYRKMCTNDKSLPPLPNDMFQLETELIPKPLFSKSRTLPPKAVHVATIELPSLEIPSPIICPSDASTISSNRSSIASDDWRPSTPATTVASGPPSRTSSFRSTAAGPTWVPPPPLPKPLFARSATLPARSKPAPTADFTFQCPSPVGRTPNAPRRSPEPPRALNLPPPRTSPLTCFSPAPAWPRTVKGARPALRHKMTPRKETLRGLRAKESDACLQQIKVEKGVAPSIETIIEKKVVPEKPVALSSLRQHSYVMDDKGVFIMDAF